MTNETLKATIRKYMEFFPFYYGVLVGGFKIATLTLVIGVASAALPYYMTKTFYESTDVYAIMGALGLLLFIGDQYMTAFNPHFNFSPWVFIALFGVGICSGLPRDSYQTVVIGISIAGGLFIMLSEMIVEIIMPLFLFKSKQPHDNP